jgi:hypothetical protein
MNFWIVLLLVIVAYFLGRRHGKKYTLKRVEQMLIRKQIQLEIIEKRMEQAENN